MSEAILKGYNSLVKGDGNSDFTIVPPSPHLHSFTKIKRWWNSSYDKVTYTECALISYNDSYIVVSCDVNVLVKIIADNNNQLDFNVIFKNQGDGGIKRILVCPKVELYGLVNYDDYYYDYGDKQIKKVTYGNGGLDVDSDAIRSYGASISVYPHDLGQLPNPITRRIDIEIEYGSGAVYDLNPIS